MRNNEPNNQEEVRAAVSAGTRSFLQDSDLDRLAADGPSLAPTTTAYSSASSTGGYMRVRARCVRSRWWAITGVTTAQEEGWRGCGLNSIIGFETPFPACLQHGASQTQLLAGKRDCPSRCSRRAHGVLGKGRPHKIPKKKSAAYLGATR